MNAYDRHKPTRCEGEYSLLSSETSSLGYGSSLSSISNSVLSARKNLIDQWLKWCRLCANKTITEMTLLKLQRGYTGLQVIIKLLTKSSYYLLSRWATLSRAVLLLRVLLVPSVLLRCSSILLFRFLLYIIRMTQIPTYRTSKQGNSTSPTKTYFPRL